MPFPSLTWETLRNKPEISENQGLLQLAELVPCFIKGLWANSRKGSAREKIHRFLKHPGLGWTSRRGAQRECDPGQMPECPAERHPSSGKWEVPYGVLMPRATGIGSCFSSPLRPHEPKEDTVHLPKRKGSRQGGFFTFFQKWFGLFSTLWQQLTGKAQVDNVPRRCRIPCPLPLPGRSFWGGLGSRSFARVLLWKLLFAKVGCEYLQDSQDKKTKAASDGSRCCHKHLGLSPAGGRSCCRAVCSLCWFPFIHLRPL